MTILKNKICDLDLQVTGGLQAAGMTYEKLPGRKEVDTIARQQKGRRLVISEVKAEPDHAEPGGPPEDLGFILKPMRNY